MGKKEIKKQIKLELAHQEFLNERNNTDSFTTPMSSAFAVAVRKEKKS